ncbi:hypothetical protein IJ818_04500 [bacterium]|nr:hypothetical protein [bacterium]
MVMVKKSSSASSILGSSSIVYASNPVKRSKSKVIKTYILSPAVKALKS